MPASQQTVVTTEVTNVTRGPLTWMSDGCQTPGYVWGEMDAVSWRPGIPQGDSPGRFKEQALGIAFTNDKSLHPHLRFVPAEEVGRGSHGCADLAMYHVIAPGETLERQIIWDGDASLRWGPPPSGPVTLTGLFHFFGRDGDTANLEIRFQHEAWVVDGVDPSWLSPPEVIDSALADPDFRAYIIEQDGANGREPILWYRPELGAWEVGLLIWNDFPDPRMHLVLVDPVSGAIVDRVDRPWDQELDGFP